MPRLFASVLFAALFIAGPALAAETAQQIIQRWEPFVILAVVPFIVQGVKKYVVPSIPGGFLPLLAGALGPALDQLTAWLAGIQGSPALAVAAGLAGVGARELLNQWSADPYGKGGLLPK